MASLQLVRLAAIAMLFAALCAAQSTPTPASSKHVMNCPDNAKTTEDCDAMGYLEKVAAFAAPGILVAVVILLSCPFYCMCKYCCNCCGGRNQHPNFCCPNTELEAQYSKGDIVRPKVCAVLVFAVGAGALIWGLLGNDVLNKGLDGFRIAIKSTPDLLDTETQPIKAALVVQLYEPTLNGGEGGFVTKDLITPEITAGLSTATGELETTTDKAEQMKEYTDILKTVMMVFFVVPAAFFLLGTIFALCNVRRCAPMTIVWFMFLFGFIVWLVHGLFAGFALVFEDVCVEVKGMANGQKSVITTISGCKDEMFSSFRSGFSELETIQSQAACQAISLMCYLATSTARQNQESGRVYNCPQEVADGTGCVGLGFSKLINWMEKDIYTHASVVALVSSGLVPNVGFTCTDLTTPCTMALCSENCRSADGKLSSVGQSSKSTYYTFESARKVSNAIDTVAAQFASCDSIMVKLTTPFATPCTDTTDGAVQIRQATGLLGMVIIACIFVQAWGAKRFIKTTEAGLPQSAIAKAKVEELDG